MLAALSTVSLTLLAVWSSSRARKRSTDREKAVGWRRLNAAFLVLLMGDGLQLPSASSIGVPHDVVLLALEVTRLSVYTLVASGLLRLTRAKDSGTPRLDRAVDAPVVLVAGAVVFLAIEGLPLSAGVFDASLMLPVATARWLACLVLVFDAALVASSPRRLGSQKSRSVVPIWWTTYGPPSAMHASPSTSWSSRSPRTRWSTTKHRAGVYTSWRIWASASLGRSYVTWKPTPSPATSCGQW